MRRATSVLAVTVLLVGAAIAFPGLGAAQPAVRDAQQSTPTDATPTETTPTDGTVDGGNDSIAPGQQFSGVVGVQQAEIDGDVRLRAFGQQVERASTNDTRARVVAENHRQNQQRLTELKQRLERLDAARENGSMSYGEYAARTARVQAELEAVRQSANETERVADDLPDETLRANGVDPDAIRMLRQNASRLGGPETAAIARSIAGPNVGQMPSDRAGGSDRAGPPDRTGGSDQPETTQPETTQPETADRGPSDGGPSEADDDSTEESATAGGSDRSGSETAG